MLNKGFVKVPRRALLKSMFRHGGPLTRMEAAVDLYLLARIVPGIVRWGKAGREISLERGELVAAYSFLARRWRWGKTTVARFVGMICEEGIARRRTVGNVTVLRMLDEKEMAAAAERGAAETGCGVENPGCGEGNPGCGEGGTISALMNVASFSLENSEIEGVRAQQDAHRNAHNNKIVIQEERMKRISYTPRARTRGAVCVMATCVSEVQCARRCAPLGCKDSGGAAGGVVLSVLRPRLTMLRPSGELCGRGLAVSGGRSVSRGEKLMGSVVQCARRCAPPGCKDSGGAAGGVVLSVLRPRLTMPRPFGELCGRGLAVSGGRRAEMSGHSEPSGQRRAVRNLMSEPVE